MAPSSYQPAPTSIFSNSDFITSPRLGPIGEHAPSLIAKTLNCETFDLHKQADQVVIVNFWASWCELCREEMPAMETHYQQHKGEGLKIIAISMDEPEDDQMVHKVMAHYSYSAAFQHDADF